MATGGQVSALGIAYGFVAASGSPNHPRLSQLPCPDLGHGTQGANAQVHVIKGGLGRGSSTLPACEIQVGNQETDLVGLGPPVPF